MGSLLIDYLPLILDLIAVELLYFNINVFNLELI